MNGPVGGLRTGQVIAGRYRVLQQLGQGGMGSVFLAEDLKLNGKHWAVKETFIGAWDRGKGEARLLRLEAEMMSRLSHPNLPQIVDYMLAEGEWFAYLVMEYIEGETLMQHFERHGMRVEARQVAEWGLQLCGLLDYMHSLRPEPVIHRDLKPANLMLAPDGRLRLIDFGTARIYKSGLAADTISIGTIGFAAPEQFAGRQSDARTDLFGLGALMFFLLGGGRHYSLNAELNGVPDKLGEIVLRLLRTDPGDRFQSAADTGIALQGWLASQQPSGDLKGKRGQAPSGRPPLVLAILSLYRGAGSTFTSLGLARLLQDRGVPHAVLEPPTPAAELHALLFADKNAPPGYSCYNMPQQRASPPWQEGQTLWLPAASGWSGAAEGVEASWWERLLLEAARPVVIADIGAEWEHPAVQELLERADELLVAVDPLMYKLELPAVRTRIRRIQEWAAEGRRVNCLANKSIRSPRSGEWLRLLPHKPSCLLPAFDGSVITEADWSGRLPHDTPQIRQALRSALGPWLDRLLSAHGIGAGAGSRGRGLGGT